MAFPIPLNLPEDWTADKAITVSGIEANLTARYGYNFLMRRINEIANAANELNDLISKLGDSLPSGGILMWSGELVNIPEGFVLCDGTNNTPNMLNRFVRGINTSTTSPGATGGTNNFTLTTAHMPSHTHTFSGSAHNHTSSTYYTTAMSQAHHHSFYNSSWIFWATDTVQSQQLTRGSYYSGYGYGNQFSYMAREFSLDSQTVSHSHSWTGYTAGVTTSGTVGNEGSGTAFDKRPAFYAVAFIMKV